MNGVRASASELRVLIEDMDSAADARMDIMVCPPATLVHEFSRLVTGSPVRIGGQDCHMSAFGAHTGDISADMFCDAGAGAVIVGHSERRANHGETDGMVRSKAEAAHRARLTAIICVGETLEEREANRAEEVVSAQIDASVPGNATAANTVIAYEPVWAIGTGKSATADDIAAMHAMIRSRLKTRFGPDGDGMRVLYGGSVKPGNAAEILAIENVDGALVGGASLKAEDFLGIIKAAL